MIHVERTQDSHLLAQLNRHVHDLHHSWQPAVFKPWDEPAVSSFFELQLQEAHCLAYVARKDQEVLGYMLLFILQHPDTAFTYARQTLRIDQILVMPQYRRLGVGEAMLNKARELAQERNIHTLELSHWNENDAAAGFFGKMGFTYYFHKMWLSLD